MKKIDKNYIFISLIAIILIIIVTPISNLFGSTTDWISQHIVFPDYFRNLFYETHETFPSLAMNIGAGQNIYYFAYYGLLNPIILISYMLPFVDMTTYIIISNILLYISFGLLIYKWLKCHFDSNLAFILSVVALLASPVLFHFHRQFMFVNYLPFLVLGLIGIDRYIDKNKSLLLIISTLLIILTSYYYSITAIITLIIYYLYRYINNNDKTNIKQSIVDLIKLSLPMIIGVLLSSVLLIPTFFALLDGRETGESISLLKLIIPKLNVDSIVYSSYTIGLTAIAIVSTILMIQSKKKSNRFLSILLLIIITVPLFIYILNGTLYIRDKILIPFIPLFIILIGEFLNEIFNKKIKLQLLIPILIYTSILFIILGYREWIYYIEIILIIILTILYCKTNKKALLFGYIILSSFVCFIITNKEDELVTKETYDILYSEEKINSINNILDNEDTIVRTSNMKDSLDLINKVYDMNYYGTSIYSSTSNSRYKNFYTNIFSNSLSQRNELMLSANSNIFYQTYMGVKYIYSDFDIIGYEKIDNNIYKNDNVLPMFYVSTNTFNENEFNNIEYPYNIEILLNNVITNSSDNKKYKSNIEEIDLLYTYKNNKNLNVQEIDNMYYITAKDDLTINLNLNEPLKNKILIVTFRVNNQHKCSENDSEIQINNVVNKLTCKKELYQNNNYVFHYVISSDKTIKNLKVSFKKGLYIIEDINTYTLDYDYIKNINDNVVEAKVDKDKTIGDIIELNVETDKDGYFVTTLPYDEGYTIYVNGKKQEYEKINTSFIGFKIDKGKYNIRIEYNANGLLLGKILSICGLISLIIYLVIEKRRNGN